MWFCDSVVVDETCLCKELGRCFAVLWIYINVLAQIFPFHVIESTKTIPWFIFTESQINVPSFDNVVTSQNTNHRLASDVTPGHLVDKEKHLLTEVEVKERAGTYELIIDLPYYINSIQYGIFSPVEIHLCRSVNL